MEQRRAEDPAVRLTELTVQRGRNTILEGLTLDIKAGQVTGLLGPSGSGKTTLLRSIVGAQARVRGTATVLGLPAGSRELRHRVAYATQAASVYDDLTVQQNLKFFARALGAAKGDVDRVISLVGLEKQSRHRVESLSGGQRNRVSLAVALLGNPEVIVLDEPTVGLDPVLRAELWDLFNELAAGGAALLVSSHVMDEALRCDRLLLLRDGGVIADTTPEQLLEKTGAADPETAFLAVIKAGGLDPSAGEGHRMEPGEAGISREAHGKHGLRRGDS